jgi:hypothetical protein
MEGVAMEAILLSQEQPQSLSMVVRVLGKGVEEVTRDVTRYLAQLKDFTHAAREEATCKGVQEWTGHAMAASMVAVPGQPPAAEVASGPPQR